jgi:hypothetical protein
MSLSIRSELLASLSWTTRGLWLRAKIARWNFGTFLPPRAFEHSLVIHGQFTVQPRLPKHDSQVVVKITLFAFGQLTQAIVLQLWKDTLKRLHVLPWSQVPETYWSVGAPMEVSACGIWISLFAFAWYQHTTSGYDPLPFFPPFLDWPRYQQQYHLHNQLFLVPVDL